MKYLLYGAIYSENILLETIYSITSLIKVMGKGFYDYKVVIITTFPKERFDLLFDYENIIIETISENVADRWINTNKKYIFNVKIFMLKYFFDKFTGDVLFVDSDTVFVNDINRIFSIIESNKFVMNFKCIGVDEIVEKYNHTAIASVEDIDSRNRIHFYRDLYHVKKVCSFYDKNKFYEIPEGFCPCNSGFIGLQYEDHKLLDTVLDVCLALCQDYNYVCAEEFAFSFVFAISGKEIVTVNDVMYHYLFEKRSRLIVGYVLGVLQETDKHKFEEYIESLNVTKDDLTRVSVLEIPYLLSYIISQKKSSASKLVDETYMHSFELFKMNYSMAKQLYKKLEI